MNTDDIAGTGLSAFPKKNAVLSNCIPPTSLLRHDN